MVSTVTARKWAARLRAEGPAGMVDRSSRPRRCPHQTPAPVRRAILELRWRQRLGPVQIGGRLGVPASTVHAVLVRAGVNWNPGVVGHATIPAHEGSPAGYALHTNQPVITEDTEREVRFAIPELLIEHSVRSTVNVVIRGEDGPFGVLEVDSRQLRKFEQDDIDFLQNYANLLASAIDRVRIQRELAERALRQEMLGHELQHRINNMLATIQAIARRTRGKSQSLDEFPHLMRWVERMRARPAVDRAYQAGHKISPPRTGGMSEEEKKVLFGQTAASVSAAVR